jgi:hypothetical protein
VGLFARCHRRSRNVRPPTLPYGLSILRERASVWRVPPLKQFIEAVQSYYISYTLRGFAAHGFLFMSSVGTFSNSEVLHISLPVLPFRALNYLPILKFMHASLLSLALKTPILITYLLILQIYDDQISLRLRISPLSSRTPFCRLQSPSRPPPRFPSARLERDELPNTSSHQSPASNLQDSHWP